MIKMSHPVLGVEVEVKKDAHARILERSGWTRGDRVAPTIGSSMYDDTRTMVEAEHLGGEVG